MYQFLVWDLLQPFTLLFLICGCALVLLWGKRRETRARLLWVTIPFVVLLALSLPPVGYVAIGSLEWQNPPLGYRPAEAQAIVVLASYAYPPNEVRHHAELDEFSMNRCLKAAELYRLGEPCPILVTGGKSDPQAPGPACAEVMREFLLKLGINDRHLLVERNSCTTYENAVECAKLLAERRIQHIILVTDATHLVRATPCFRKQGLEVVPCGCQYRATKFEPSVSDFLPNPNAADHSQQACHEWLGTLWYWLRGRI